jgi:antitoxin component YwqK of YwqJK toxin-antitoxin module
MNLSKLLFLSCLVILLTSSCLLAQNLVDAKGLKQGEWRKTDSKGNLVYQGRFKDNVPQGVFKYYYEDGKVRSELTYSVDGKTANATNFYHSGKKMAEGNYFETKKDGLWKYYNDLEILSAEESYLKGLPIGLWKTYYDDGKLLEECPYKNGFKDGVCKQFFMDGRLKSEVNFINGKNDGFARFYFTDGKPMVLGQFKNDLKTGLWVTFKENGEKVSDTEYVGGIVSKEIFYDKAREQELKNDVKEIPE